MKSIVEIAQEIAAFAHRGQPRKYSGMPYITHPEEVAQLVMSVPHTDEMVAAAWLHDTIEDTDISASQIANECGNEVAALVEMLTDVSVPEDGNRKARKAKDLAHTARASSEAKTIKLADLISNSRSIFGYAEEGNKDAKAFARLYAMEKRALLEVLVDGEPLLWEYANAILVHYEESK